MDIKTWLLPDQIAPDQLEGRIAIVIDVLRASTTILTALESGAEAVRPCESIESARKRATECPRPVLLGGERGGIRIEGFQLGNSPAEYTPNTVEGYTIFFTTTNGTRALARCEKSAEVWIGCFLNRQAISRRLNEGQKLAIVCAGTNGEVSREDVLAAGAIIAAVCQRFSESVLDDSSRIALASWNEVWRNETENSNPGHPPKSITREPIGDENVNALAGELRDTYGGRNLIRIGQDSDIERAARLDHFDLVPFLSDDRQSIQLQ